VLGSVLGVAVTGRVGLPGAAGGGVPLIAAYPKAPAWSPVRWGDGLPVEGWKGLGGAWGVAG
jgi:hypothetical protein